MAYRSTLNLGNRWVVQTVSERSISTLHTHVELVNSTADSDAMPEPENSIVEVTPQRPVGARGEISSRSAPSQRNLLCPCPVY